MYNEKAIAADCAASLVKELEADSLANSYEYEIVFSDDGSTDGCGDCVREYVRANPPMNGVVRVITSPENEGKGGAVRRGMLAAEGDYIMFTDCDLAYGTEIIPQMFRAAVEVSEKDDKCAVMIGSRAIHKDGYAGYTFIRKLASKVFKNCYAQPRDSVTAIHKAESKYSGTTRRRQYSRCVQLTDGRSTLKRS